MNQYKKLLSNTFLFTIGTFSSKLLVFFMLRFYTKTLTTDEWGIADLIVKTTNILYPLVSLSIGQAVIRYGLEKGANRRRVFTTGMVVILVGFLVSTPFAPLFSLFKMSTSAGESISMAPYTLLIYLYVLVSCVQNCCSQFIRAIGMVRLYAIDGIFRTALTIGFNILFLAVFRWGIVGYVCSIILSDFISTLCLFAIAELPRFFRPRTMTRPATRAMLSYSLPLVPAAILVFLIGYISQFMLSTMLDTTASGLYAFAYRIPTMITLVASIFIDAWQISSINDNSEQQQIAFFSKVGNLFASIVMIITSGAVLCTKLFITVLAATPAYYEAWRYVPTLALSAAFSCLASYANSIYTLEKKTVQSFLSTLFTAVLNIALNYWLIQTMGATGAALAALFSYLFLFVYRAVDTRRFLAIRWNAARLLTMLCIVGLQTWIMLAEAPFWPLWQILLFGAICLLGGRELIAGFARLLGRKTA